MLRMSSLVAGATLLASVAAAQPSGLNASPATIDAIKACRLEPAQASTLTKALEEMTAAVTSDPEGLKALTASMRKPLEERISMMDADPRARRVLQANGLTAHDYTVGTLALRAAVWSLSSQGGGLATLANPANVAMLKAHPDIVDRFGKAEQGRVSGQQQPK